LKLHNGTILVVKPVA